MDEDAREDVKNKLRVLQPSLTEEQINKYVQNYINYEKSDEKSSSAKEDPSERERHRTADEAGRKEKEQRDEAARTENERKKLEVENKKKEQQAAADLVEQSRKETEAEKLSNDRQTVSDREKELAEDDRQKQKQKAERVVKQTVAELEQIKLVSESNELEYERQSTSTSGLSDFHVDRPQSSRMFSKTSNAQFQNDEDMLLLLASRDSELRKEAETGSHITSSSTKSSKTDSSFALKESANPESQPNFASTGISNNQKTKKKTNADWRKLLFRPCSSNPEEQRAIDELLEEEEKERERELLETHEVPVYKEPVDVDIITVEDVFFQPKKMKEEVVEEMEFEIPMDQVSELDSGKHIVTSHLFGFDEGDDLPVYGREETEDSNTPSTNETAADETENVESGSKKDVKKRKWGQAWSDEGQLTVPEVVFEESKFTIFYGNGFVQAEIVKEAQLLEAISRMRRKVTTRHITGNPTGEFPQVSCTNRVEQEKAFECKCPGNKKEMSKENFYKHAKRDAMKMIWDYRNFSLDYSTCSSGEEDDRRKDISFGPIKWERRRKYRLRKSLSKKQIVDKEIRRKNSEFADGDYTSSSPEEIRNSILESIPKLYRVEMSLELCKTCGGRIPICYRITGFRPNTLFEVEPAVSFVFSRERQIVRDVSRCTKIVEKVKAKELRQRERSLALKMMYNNASDRELTFKEYYEKYRKIDPQTVPDDVNKFVKLFDSKWIAQMLHKTDVPDESDDELEGIVINEMIRSPLVYSSDSSISEQEEIEEDMEDEAEIDKEPVQEEVAPEVDNQSPIDPTVPNAPKGRNASNFAAVSATFKAVPHFKVPALPPKKIPISSDVTLKPLESEVEKQLDKEPSQIPANDALSDAESGPVLGSPAERVYTEDELLNDPMEEDAAITEHNNDIDILDEPIEDLNDEPVLSDRDEGNTKSTIEEELIELAQVNAKEAEKKSKEKSVTPDLLRQSSSSPVAQKILTELFEEDELLRSVSPPNFVPSTSGLFSSSELDIDLEMTENVELENDLGNSHKNIGILHTPDPNDIDLEEFQYTEEDLLGEYGLLEPSPTHDEEPGEPVAKKSKVEVKKERGRGKKVQKEKHKTVQEPTAEVPEVADRRGRKGRRKNNELQEPQQEELNPATEDLEANSTETEMASVPPAAKTPTRKRKQRAARIEPVLPQNAEEGTPGTSDQQAGEEEEEVINRPATRKNARNQNEDAPFLPANETRSKRHFLSKNNPAPRFRKCENEPSTSTPVRTTGVAVKNQVLGDGTSEAFKKLPEATQRWLDGEKSPTKKSGRGDADKGDLISEESIKSEPIDDENWVIPDPILPNSRQSKKKVREQKEKEVLAQIKKEIGGPDDECQVVMVHAVGDIAKQELIDPDYQILAGEYNPSENRAVEPEQETPLFKSVDSSLSENPTHQYLLTKRLWDFVNEIFATDPAKASKLMLILANDSETRGRVFKYSATVEDRMSKFSLEFIQHLASSSKELTDEEKSCLDYNTFSTTFRNKASPTLASYKITAFNLHKIVTHIIEIKKTLFKNLETNDVNEDCVEATERILLSQFISCCLKMASLSQIKWAKPDHVYRRLEMIYDGWKMFLSTGGFFHVLLALNRPDVKPMSDEFRTYCIEYLEDIEENYAKAVHIANMDDAAVLENFRKKVDLSPEEIEKLDKDLSGVESEVHKHKCCNCYYKDLPTFFSSSTLAMMHERLHEGAIDCELCYEDYNELEIVLHRISSHNSMKFN